MTSFFFFVMHLKLWHAQVLINTAHVKLQLFDPNLFGGHVGISVLTLWQFIQRSSSSIEPKTWGLVSKGLLYHPAARNAIFFLANRSLNKNSSPARMDKTKQSAFTSPIHRLLACGKFDHSSAKRLSCVACDSINLITSLRFCMRPAAPEGSQNPAEAQRGRNILCYRPSELPLHIRPRHCPILNLVFSFFSLNFVCKEVCVSFVLCFASCLFLGIF